MAKDTKVTLTKEELDKCKDTLAKLIFLSKELNCTLDVAATVLSLIAKK